MQRSLLVVVCISLLAMYPLHAANADDTRIGPVPGQASARALELRLVAPCCWNQTLDVHESEIATALRKEIRVRLLRGEPGAAIEDDFARRYGERIRAVPRGEDPRTAVPLLIGILMIVGALALVAVGRRWMRRSAMDLKIEADAQPFADDYDRKLDEELQRL